jgi:hypothetical protein
MGEQRDRCVDGSRGRGRVWDRRSSCSPLLSFFDFIFFPLFCFMKFSAMDKEGKMVTWIRPGHLSFRVARVPVRAGRLCRMRLTNLDFWEILYGPFYARYSMSSRLFKLKRI